MAGSHVECPNDMVCTHVDCCSCPEVISQKYRLGSTQGGVSEVCGKCFPLIFLSYPIPEDNLAYFKVTPDQILFLLRHIHLIGDSATAGCLR